MAVAFLSLTRIGISGRFFLAVVILASLAFAAGGAKADGAGNRGPKLGETIPPVLTAADQTGVAKSFPDMAGERGLILLFTRSLNW